MPSATTKSASDWSRANSDLAAILVAIASHRLHRLGEIESGAYNYYASRLRAGWIFTEYDLAIAAALVEGKLAFDAVHEVGAGFGQLALLLAWNGIKAIGFERDPRTFATARLLWDAIKLIEPEAGSRARIVETVFPPQPDFGYLGRFGVSPDLRLEGDRFPPDNDFADTAGSLVLATNLAVTLSPERQQEVVRAMRAYRYALIDVDRFFGQATRPQEREPVFALFARAGFVPPRPFLDLGASGCFCLFEGRPEKNAGGPAIDLGALARWAIERLSRWIAERPERKRSAADYYLDKLARGVLFETYDIALAEYAGRDLPRNASIVELGSGYGELSLMLALKGFRVLGMEADEGRHEGCTMLMQELASLGLRLPALGFVLGSFPDALPETTAKTGETVLACTNVTSSDMMERMEQILRVLPRFDHLIIEVSRFGETRDLRSIQSLLAAIGAAGFRQRASVFGLEGCDIRHFTHGG